MKKLLALLLAVMMVVGLLAACNPTPDPTDPPAVVDPTDPPSADPTDPPAPQKNVDRYPLQGNRTFRIANRTANCDTGDAFQVINKGTGLDVEWVEMSGDVLATTIAAGDIPDAICVSWGIDKNVIYEYGTAGKFLNFMDYLEYMPNFQKVMEKYPHCLDSVINEDGTVYSLPCQSAGFGGPGNIMYVRSDMVKDAGLTLPKTVDEFKQFILDLQAYYGHVEGFKALNFIQGDEWGYIEWNGLVDNYFFPAFGSEATQTGYDIVDGKIVLGCTTEQYKRYLNFIADLYASGACEQDIWSSESTSNNKARAVANQYVVGPTLSGVTASNFASGNVEVELIAPLTSQWQSEQIWTNSTVPTWMLNCVNGTLPEEEKILLVKWFDALYSTEEDPLNAEGTIWGISLWKGEKDVHFTLNKEEGTCEMIYSGEWSSPSEWSANEVCSTSLYGSAFPYLTAGNTVFYHKQTNMRDVMWPHMVERANVNTIFLNDDESYDAAAINTDLNIYMEASFAKFIVGTWTVENNWDEYMKGLESLGALDLVDIYQAAYDRMQ